MLPSPSEPPEVSANSLKQGKAPAQNEAAITLERYHEIFQDWNDSEPSQMGLVHYDLAL